MDVYGAQRGMAGPGLGTVVKAQEHHVLRDLFAQGIQGLEGVKGGKVVGADEQVGQLVQGADRLRQHLGPTVAEQEALL